jgi:hypothetical protein
MQMREGNIFLMIPQQHLAQRAKTLEMAEDTPYRFLHLAIRCHFDAVGVAMANKSDWYFG